MKKVRLGLCIGDNEYSLRFTNCIMNHYQEQVELHIYSENAELKRDRKSYDIVLIDDVKNAEKWGGEVPVLCLYDSKEGTEKQEEGGVYWVEQYQEVNRIVDEILKQDEINGSRDLVLNVIYPEKKTVKEILDNGYIEVSLKNGAVKDYFLRLADNREKIVSNKKKAVEKAQKKALENFALKKLEEKEAGQS